MDVDQAVNTSKAFGLAFTRCQEQRRLADGRFEMLIVPSIACLALAIEIGLKAILLRDGGAARGHSLEKLFGALSLSSREALIRALGMKEDPFLASLHLVSDAFVEWRYIYERGNAQVDLAFLNALHQGVQSLIAAPRS